MLSKINALFEKFNASRVATWLIFAVAAIAFYLLVKWTPFFADDFFYSLVRGSSERLDSFSGLCYSWFWHYFDTSGLIVNSNGRFANAPLCMILEWLGKPIVDVLQTGVFLIFIVTLWRLAFPRVRKNSDLLATLAVVFFFIPLFAETMLWLCGSANYLWAGTFCCVFFVIFEKLASGWRAHWAAMAIFAVFSLVAGWMHECFSLGACVGLLAYAIVNRKNLNARLWVVSVAFALGAIFCVFAPGTLHRGNSVLGGDASLYYTIVKYFYHGAIILLRSPLCCLLLLLGAFAFWRSREKMAMFCKKNVFFVGAFLGSFPLTIIFSTGGRATFGLFVFALICLGRLIDFYGWRKIYNYFAALAIMAMIAYYPVVLNTIYSHGKTINEFYRNYEQSKNEVVIFDEPELQNSRWTACFHGCPAVVYWPNYWFCQTMHAYFNKKSSRVVMPSDCKKIIDSPDKKSLLNNWYTQENWGIFVKKMPATPIKFYKITPKKSAGTLNDWKFKIISACGFWKSQVGVGGEKNIGSYDIWNVNGEQYMVMLKPKKSIMGTEIDVVGIVE